jgi:hypothetical protein
MNVDIIMLKNKTKEQIKNKFNSKPTIFNHLFKDDKIDNTLPVIEDMMTSCNNNPRAFIDVPNYLESPVFKYSKTLLICLFQIVMESMTPFLLYLLRKTKDELNLVQMSSFDGGKNNKRLKKDSVEYMESIIAKGEISYVGFTETVENNILFLKYVPYADFKTLADNYYWATVHELINLKTVLHLPIALNVTHFFLNQPKMLFLTNEEDMVYEYPVIGYYLPQTDCLHDETIDIFREMKYDKYGKCYYFHINLPMNDRPIMRTALFLQRTGLINDSLNEYNSIVYHTKQAQYYLIKSYAQHLLL